MHEVRCSLPSSCSLSTADFLPTDATQRHQQFSAHLSEFFELLSSASTNPHRPTHPDSSISLHNISGVSGAFRPILPVLSGKSPHAPNQNPVVTQARLEAELAVREFLPQLLLRLDFAKWFSLAGEREHQKRERQEERERQVNVLQGLRLD